MHLLIKNVKVVKPEIQNVEIGIEYEKIVSIKKCHSCSADKEIDGKGMLVFPGFIDAHVHFYDGKALKYSSFRSESYVALSSGITTYIEMPTESEVIKKKEIEEKIKIASKESFCDFSIHCGNMRYDKIKYVYDAHSFGIKSFKSFTCDPYRMEYRDIKKLMNKCREIGGIVLVHCEDQDVLDSAEKAESPEDYPNSRPSDAEVRAIERIVSLANESKCQTHIVHVSTERGGSLIHGKNLTAEACLHHLLLTSDDMKKQGANLKINPPLRGKKDVDALWRYLMNDKINFVATDHFYVPKEMKEGDINEVPPGVPGIDAFVPLIYTYGVIKRGMSLSRFQEIMSEEPAKRFFIYPRKGIISVGADADLVIMDIMHRGKFNSDRDWSPYENMEINCRVSKVIMRGKLVAEDGEVLDDVPRGIWLGDNSDLD